MFHLVCILITLASYNILGVNSKCSYYQIGDVPVPTDSCTNSTLLADNTYVSSSYSCYLGLFRTSIYIYYYNTQNCMGTPIQTYVTPCKSSTCSCSSTNSPSQCKSNTFSYDTSKCEPQQFKQQNLTIVTSECINSVTLKEHNNTLYYLKYSDTDTNCNDNIQSIQPTCYTLDTNEYYDYYDGIDTDIDPYIQPTKETKKNNSILFEGYKQIFIVGIIIIILFGTFCTICCMVKKYKKKKQINQLADAHKKNLIENKELNEEGIENYNDIGENIDIIPGQNEMIQIDQNIVDKIVNEYINNSDIDNDNDIDDDNDDIPAPAFSDALSDDYGNDNDNDQDDNNDENELDYSISEGNEGIVNVENEQESTDNDQHSDDQE